MDRNTIDNLGTEEEARAWAEDSARKWEAVGRAAGHPLNVQIEECYADNVERLEKEVERLGKIAARHGQPRPAVSVSPTTYTRKIVVEARDPEGHPYEKKVSVLCHAIVIAAPDVIGDDGWEVVGVKVLLPGEEAIISSQGVDLPFGFYSGSGHCDQCHKNRRRNEVVIIRRDDEFRQVGKECLKEAIGIGPEYVLALAALYRAQPWAGGEHVRHLGDLGEWLRWVAVAVRLDGRYVSQATADRENEGRWSQFGVETRPLVPTTTTRAGVLYSRSLHNRKEAEAAGEVPTGEDDALVAAVRAHVATLDPDQSRYARNLTALFRADCLLPRLDGLAASAFASYLREQRAVAEARARAEQQPSAWVGQPRERLTLTGLTVTRVSTWDGTFGLTHIYGFVDGAGNRFVWWSSEDQELTVGQVVGLRGTVKKHDEYRGVKETTLTRCAIQ